MVTKISRFDVFLVNLDPTQGSEIKKTRPALVVSSDEMNDELHTVIMAPLTTTIRHYPSRVTTTFKGKKGQVALDQIRTLDKNRLLKYIGKFDEAPSKKVVDTLQKIFAW